jgi:hypothetical protein
LAVLVLFGTVVALAQDTGKTAQLIGVSGDITSLQKRALSASTAKDL